MTGRLRSFAAVHRLVSHSPAGLTVAQAARLAFPTPGQVDLFAREIADRGASRALLRAHRGWLGAYALVGVVVVGLGPVVPAVVAAVAPRLREGRLTAGLALGAIGAVLVAAVARTLSTWIVRGLVYQMTHLVKLAVFARLQVIRPQWLAAEGRSSSMYLVTAPMQLAQVAFAAQLAVNSVLIAVLVGYLILVFGLTGAITAAVTGLIVVGWQRLVRRQTGLMHGYIDHGHRRIALVDAVTRHWQAIGRQQWERPVLEATDRARDGQFGALRSSARAAGALGVIGGGVLPFVCLVALLLPGRLTGGLALLLVVQQLITAIKENLGTYASVAWAATMGRDVRALFRDAPVVAPAELEAAAGSVRFGVDSVPPGARVVLLGPGDDVRRVLDALTGSAGPAPAIAAVAGSVATVSRGEPELDGSIEANITMWRPPDRDRYAEAIDRAGLFVRSRDLATGQRRLSDGEAARLALARAWYQAPDVLILDDTLSALDPATAVEVAAGIFGTAGGPTRVYVGTRTDPAPWATHVVLCGPEPVLIRAEAVTGVELAAVLKPAEAARWRSALRVAALAVARPAGGNSAGEPPSVEAVLAGVEVERDVAAPRLRDAAANLAGLFSRRALVLLGAVVAGLVVVDLAIAGVFGRPAVSLSEVALLAAAGALLTGLYQVVVMLGALPATRALHQQILGLILRHGLPSGSATAAGRFTEDFTTVELWSPGILIGGVQATVATIVSVAAMALATPVVLVGVAALAGLAAVGYPRLRRNSVRGRALLAATRGPIRTYGGAVIGSRSFVLSSALRPAFHRRYRDMLAIEHVALYAAHGSRLAIVAAVEAAGALLFGVMVMTAALAPVGLGGLLAVAVYASYAIGERFASLVEAHQEVDGTAQVLGRVSDMLTARSLPRQRTTRRGPATAAEVMAWLAPAVPSPARAGAGAEAGGGGGAGVEAGGGAGAQAGGGAGAQAGAEAGSVGGAGVERQIAVIAAADRGPALSHLDLAGVAPGSGLALVVERLVTTVHGRVAEPVDLSVRGGQLVAVRGESGAGKSVLLRTLAGLSPAVSGTVLVAGRAPAPYERSGRAALRLVENDPPPLPIPVAELCVAAAVELAVEWCVALGLAAPDPGAPVGTLEPAQRQVVALAAACAAGPAVLLVDETTSALDPAGERALLTLIRDRLPDTAIVAVLHRPDNVDLADAEVLVSTAVNGPPAADVSRADSMPGRANGRRATSMPGAPTSVPGLPACGLRGKGHTGRV